MSTSDTTSVVEATTSTSEVKPLTSMAAGEAIPGTSLRALVPGNDYLADRINLVIAPWGWAVEVDFERIALAMLSWDGDAYFITETGAIGADPTTAVGAQLGVFGIEPWRSSRDRFNVWITDVEPESPVSWVNQTEPPFSLPDQSVVVLALDAGRYSSDLTSVAGFDVHFVGPDPPQRPAAGNPFANVAIVLDSEFPSAGLLHVPHELGHAMFNLPDEYVGQQLGYDDRGDLSSWPSCATDESQAHAWWGDLVGMVDPMVDTWGAEMDQAGFSMGDMTPIAQAVSVTDVDGGCYGVSGTIRATSDSLMNTNIPVLGSVNRRWAEQILLLWQGTPRQ